MYVSKYLDLSKYSDDAAVKTAAADRVALMTPAAMGLPVGEYAANLVKKSIVGTGHAEKSQIQLMVRTLLPAAEVLQRAHVENAADLCEGNYLRLWPHRHGTDGFFGAIMQRKP